MNVATTVPAQRAADSSSIDAALRESLAREFHVSAWQVEAIYREELCRLAAGARITTFLGVLATRRVRARLRR
jgi:Protein of unknown function (DUF3562)